jgi:hypothetical protein
MNILKKKSSLGEPESATPLNPPFLRSIGTKVKLRCIDSTKDLSIVPRSHRRAYYNPPNSQEIKKPSDTDFVHPSSAADRRNVVPEGLIVRIIAAAMKIIDVFKELSYLHLNYKFSV